MRYTNIIVAIAALQWIPLQAATAQRPPAEIPARPPTHVDATFTLVPTQNVWTFLLLDSRNGRVWQVHYSVSDSAFSGRLPVNEEALATGPSAHVGRFSLQPTQNTFNFLLLDQDDGRVWQVQWSNTDKLRGVVGQLSGPIP